MTLHALTRQLKDWYADRTARERLLLPAGLLLAAVVLVHAAVWRPLSDRLKKTEQRLERLRGDLSAMRRMLPQIIALRRTTTHTRRGQDGRSLQTLINQTAMDFKLQDRIRQITPGGTDRLQVSLRQAPFDQLVRWLGRLQSHHHVYVQTLATERDATRAGIVDAQISFARAAP